MTIHDALELISQTKQCWVVWSSTTGEVLEVTDAARAEPHAHVDSLKQYSGPVQTRWFDSAKVSRKVLEEQARDIARVKERSATLAVWTSAPLEDLLRILESDKFSYPMARDSDSRILIDHIWKFHRAELETAGQLRLRALLDTQSLGQSAARHLAAYLLALDGDRVRLAEMWRKRTDASWDLRLVLMDCLAHVGVADREVIQDLIAVVENDGLLFEPRFKAMMTLGRLDAARDFGAADAIRAAIYDSEPWIAATKDRVLRRLTTPDSTWEPCRYCSDGLISSPQEFGEQPCSRCLGLTLVPIGDAKAGPS
jgi:hypothetical protein